MGQQEPVGQQGYSLVVLRAMAPPLRTGTGTVISVTESSRQLQGVKRQFFGVNCTGLGISKGGGDEYVVL